MRVPRDVAPRVKGRRIELELPATERDPAVPVAFTLGTFAKSSLYTRDAATADSRRLAIVAHLSRVYEAARRDTVVLSQRQTVALAGEVYRRLREAHHDNPGTEEQWSAWKAFTRAALEGRISDVSELPLHPDNEEAAAAQVIFGNDLTAGVDALPRTQDKRTDTDPLIAKSKAILLAELH